MTHPINIAEKFAQFDEAWSPKRIGQVDDYDVRIAKLRGSFEWHSHADADEMFLVVSGELRMHFRDGAKDAQSGEIIIVPKGIEHKPEALSEECQVMLIEKSDVVNTGDGEANDRTRLTENL